MTIKATAKNVAKQLVDKADKIKVKLKRLEEIEYVESLLPKYDKDPLLVLHRALTAKTLGRTAILSTGPTGKRTLTRLVEKHKQKTNKELSMIMNHD